MAALDFNDAIENRLIRANDPIVRESTYNRLKSTQTIYFARRPDGAAYEFVPGERPVMMRGSRFAISMKYLVKRWYVQEVFERYLTLYKVTFLYREEFLSFIYEKLRHPGNIYARTNEAGLNEARLVISAMFPRGNRRNQYHVIVGGKPAIVDSKQFTALKAMQKLILKMS